MNEFKSCEDELPAKNGEYDIKNNSGCNNGEGRLWYDTVDGWDIAECIRSFYKVLAWRPIPTRGLEDD
jgi:hypothetical protein